MIHHNTLDAIAFYQTSAENHAIYLQTFALARWRLMFEYENRVCGGESPENFYIISDLDETLLDNSAYNAYLIETGRDFHEETWAQWCETKESVGTPGAKAFVDFVSSIGVEIYYVSSRYNYNRAATAANLQKPEPALGLNFPLRDASEDASKTHLFLEGMQLVPGGPKTKKQEQYEFIRKNRANGSRPLLQLGDNLSDHNPETYGSKISYKKRLEDAKEDLLRWGADWIVFPNPIYGNWRKSLHYMKNNAEAPAADEEPPKPYQPTAVRAPVTADEAPKLSILNRWDGV